MTIGTSAHAWAALLLLTTACSSEPPERIWWQPGYAPAQFAIDRNQCQALAREKVRIPIPTYLDVLRRKDLRRKFVIGCLYTKGYRQYLREDLAPSDQETLEV